MARKTNKSRSSQGPAAKSSSEGSGARKASSTNGGAHGTADDGLALLTQQHEKMRALIKKLGATTGASRGDVQPLRELCSLWNKHASHESEIAFPTFEEGGVDEDLIHKTAVEADIVSILVSDLIRRDKDDPYFEPVLTVLIECATRVMDAEEQEPNGIYAKAKSKDVDLVKLAEALIEASSQQEAAGIGPRLLHIQKPQKNKEAQYMRGSERERDERGRFVEDDDRRGRSSAARHSYSRSSSRYDDDDEGRGWHGDPRGHAEASRRGWDERRESHRGRDYDDDDDRRSYRGREDYDDRGSRSRSAGYDDRRDRRTGGWFGDSEGHAEASRRGWDSPDHGPSGWYGDREGHRDAARRGWDNPDHGPSGWYGDREGHREAAMRGWDNPDHGPSGWYGDSEGHSEASRKGWDDRRRSSSRRR